MMSDMAGSLFFVWRRSNPHPAILRRPCVFTHILRVTYTKNQHPTAAIPYARLAVAADSGQFEASLCMLDKCIRECPTAHWENRIANGSVRRAYLTLYYGFLYLCPSLEAFEPTEFHHRGGPRPAGVTTCVGLTKDD